MNKNFLPFLLLLFFSVSAHAVTGIFQTYVFLNLNGSVSNYEGNITNPNNTSITSFDGLSLNDPSSLTLTGAEAHTFKNGGGDVTGGRIYYRIYESGTVAPAYTTLAFGFSENCPSGGNFNNTVGGQCTANSTDQKWNATGQMIDVLNGITNNGMYNFEVYIEMDTNEGTRNDGTSASPLTATITFTVLPVELLGFTAKPNKDQVELAWATASELNNSYFEIERSRNSKEWSIIGKLQGNGTTVETNYYNFQDQAPYIGVNYYRLKQMDIDGEYEYSEVLAVLLEEGNDEIDIAIYPTLVEEQLTVENGIGEAIIYNQLGQIIKRTQLTDFVSHIDVSDLTNGQYVLFLTTQSGRKFVERFVK